MAPMKAMKAAKKAMKGKAPKIVKKAKTVTKTKAAMVAKPATKTKAAVLTKAKAMKVMKAKAQSKISALPKSVQTKVKKVAVREQKRTPQGSPQGNHDACGSNRMNSGNSAKKDKPSCPRQERPALEVATWATLRLDKRSKSNNLICDTPCIVSRVNVEDSTVNVLFPNAISMCFNKADSKYPILFAIQTYPSSVVKPYIPNDVARLNDVLIKALLYFAERRGRGLCNGNGLEVKPSAEPAVLLNCAGKLTGGPKMEAEQIQRSTRQFQELPKVAELPEKASSTTPSPRTAPTSMTPPPLGRPLLREFTKKVSVLFRGQPMISQELIRTELGGEFPHWRAHLEQLDAVNKVMLAEDAVFMV